MDVEETLQLPEQKQKLLFVSPAFCPRCDNVIQAEIIEEDNKVYMLKNCCNEEFKILIENDVEFYKKTSSITPRALIPPVISNDELVHYQDSINSIMFHVTNKCNQNCNVCIASWRQELSCSESEIDRALTGIK